MERETIFRCFVILITSLAAFLFTAVPVIAPIDAIVTRISQTEGALVIEDLIGKGLDAAAREGNAPFEIELAISYITADNIQVSVNETVSVRDTKIIDTKGGMVRSEITITRGEPFPPPASDIGVNLRVVSRTSGKSIILAESQSTCSPITFSCTQTAMRKIGSPGDYFPIKLEIDGVVVGSFKEISGLESETEIIEYQDGDDVIIRKLRGRVNYSSIALERGFINDPAFIDWVKEVMKGCQQANDDAKKEPAEKKADDPKKAKIVNKDTGEELREAGPPIGHVDHGKGSIKDRGGYITICDPESIPDALERKSGSIIVLDRAGQEAMRYNLYGAVPISWKGPALDTKGDTHTVEELVLAVEKIEVRKTVAEAIPIIFNFADGDVKAEVNPESIQIIFDPNENAPAKAKPWKHHSTQGLDSPTFEFTSGEPYRLEMELFFDRYEEGKSVREWTDQVEKLALVDTEKHRPPTILLTFRNLAYEGVLESAQTRFTLFLDDGTPARAVMSTVWKEFSLDKKSSIDKDNLPPSAPCRFYSWCWEKASGGSCCKTVAVCDTGTSSVTHCTGLGGSV
ncbi:MAG: phage tail protein [DPANN group archaeon]|nr:phage tail protein [DPANN group archaeon]